MLGIRVALWLPEGRTTQGFVTAKLILIMFFFIFLREQQQVTQSPDLSGGHCSVGFDPIAAEMLGLRGALWLPDGRTTQGFVTAKLILIMFLFFV